MVTNQLVVLCAVLVVVLADSCPSDSIPHSNRSSSTPCPAAPMGAECFFSCEEGFIRRGRHVCQTYATSGHTYINQTYFGGECVPLCDPKRATCNTGNIPIRWEEEGCLVTTCMEENEALVQLGRSNFQVWEMGRNPTTGIFMDHVSLRVNASGQDWNQGGMGMTGLGLIVECAAAELGWLERDDLVERVNQTLSSLAGKRKGFVVARNADGWAPTFVNSNTGASLQPPNSTAYSTLATGLNAAGVLFAAQYVGTEEIWALAEEIVASVRWETLLCSNGMTNTSGNEVCMVKSLNGSICSATEAPEADGYYQYYELEYTVWITYERCRMEGNGSCKNPAIQAMWDRWDGRKFHPNLEYASHPLLSMWSCYIVHLPLFTTHAFNSDPDFLSLYHSHWLADQAYYKSSAYYAGDDGEYGLGAGPTDPSCTGGAGYDADRIQPSNPGAPGCRIISPYCITGYLPTATSTILPHIHALLASGRTVVPINTSNSETPSFILLRKGLVDPSWNQTYDITLVDFSSEFLGIAGHLLGLSFFQNYTNHFPPPAP